MLRLCPRCQQRFAADVQCCPVHGTPLRTDPFIGARIGDWTLTEFVGQGAMGVVYAAEPAAAIKILHARRAAMQPGLVHRFEIEAQAAMRLQSRHIARVFDSGVTDDGHLYIAMELLRGEPLDAILDRSPRLPAAAAATIAHQIALALQEAHAAQIVHRDLKPANVFVEPAPGGGRHVRVLDFGVARINSESVARSHTGSVAGTPAYMSPEQLRGEPDIDGRSDIYSLGVLLYQLLAGFNPFRGSGGVMATLQRHLDLIPPPIEGIPAPLDHLVHGLLAKPREARPQTMERVQQLLALTGLVSSGADAQTIPGISREVLIAAGITEVPDPESQPLVRHFGGRPPPPPRSEPPPDGALTSATRIPSVEAPVAPDRPIGERPPRRWAPALGLVALGIALGLAVYRVGSSPAPEPVADAAPPLETARPEPPGATARSLVALGEAAMAAERWDEARRLFDSALDRTPDDATARAGRRRAGREAVNERLWGELSRAARDEAWSPALAAVQGFPPDSVYAVRAEALRPTIEAGYARSRLAEARAHLGAGRLDAAEAIQAELDTKPFARDAAEALTRELAEAKQRAAAASARPSREPDFDDLMRQALARYDRGQMSAAVGLLQRAARLRPRSALPFQRLCIVYEAQRRYENAVASCRKWLENEPNSSHHPIIERRITRLRERAAGQ